MGPGCPVCITDLPEIDEAIALADQGVRIATYGDMVRVPGTAGSLADAQARGARIDTVYSVAQAVDLARAASDEVVFFATGFETTAVATAAVLLAGVPTNFSVLSAHKYIPPVMEIVAEMPETRVEGFLAAGHAATITGCGIFEPFVKRHGLPVVVAGFEPLDILAAPPPRRARARSLSEVVNMFPRCDAQAPERAASTLACLPPDRRTLARYRAREPARRMGGGRAAPFLDRRRAAAGRRAVNARAPAHLRNIMAGIASPADCPLAAACLTADGACMVSGEGRRCIGDKVNGDLSG